MAKIQWVNDKRKLSELVPWPRNPRQIRKDEAERLSDSLHKFDQVETIAIGPDNEIYNGHQRLNVWVEEFGPDFEVDVRVASRALSEKEREKLTIYLHKGASGEWDYDVLANEFDVLDLMDWGFSEKELEVHGFDFGDNGDAPDAQIDKAEELQKKWQVERGQIWEIGRHRLMCGDSTSEEDVGRLMEEDVADLVFTDPPYNIDYDYNSDYDDDKPANEYLEFVNSFVEFLVKYSKESCPFYIMSANNRQDDFKRIFIDNGLRFHQWLYWVKPHPGYLGRSDYIQNYETVNYGYKGKHQFYGKMQLAAEVIDRDLGQDKVGHPAQRPLELLHKIIKNSSQRDDLVVDVFLGSGTTMVAAEQLNRICYGMEIEPKYCAVTLERMSEMGLEPRLVKHG